MTIRVYSSILPGAPEEVYHDHGMTVEAWVKSRTPNYQRGSVQPVSCSVNGAIINPVDWCDVVIDKDDVVEFRVVPRGDVLNVLNVAFPFWGGSLTAANEALSYLIPEYSSPSALSSSGSTLDAADARANTARPGEAIPELFGRYIRYPDYVVPPRTIFSSGTKQTLYMFLCIGVGEYQYNESTLKIGNSYVGDLDGVSYQFFGPGEDVSGHEASQNWYSCPEVGATTGTSGIELTTATTYTETLSASQYDYSGTTLTVPYGAGDIPEDWEVGMELIIQIVQDVEVINSGDDGSGNYLPDVLRGDFSGLSASDEVTIYGAAEISGDYVVSTLTPGTTDEMTLLHDDLTPAVFLPAGTYRAGVDLTGVRYRIDSFITETVSGTTRRKGVNVTRLLPDGTEDASWAGFPATSQSDSVVMLDTTSIESGWIGPFTACPAGETTTKLEVDTFFPSGIGRYTGGGSFVDIDLTVEYQWREVDSGDPWTSVKKTYNGKTQNQIGYTEVIDLPSAIRPEVRARRIGAKNTNAETVWYDDMEWYGLRSLLETPTSYEGITTLALEVVGSDEIASQSENRVNLVPIRKLDGVATRSIAAAAQYVAKSLGYTDDNIDTDEFDRLDAIWTARADTFDFVFSSGTALDAINTILRPGFAEITVTDGVLTPVRDEERTTFEQGYSPENMTGSLQRQFSARQVDESDGVEVEYTDSETWTTETVICTLPGDQQIKLDKITLDGVTDRTRAWRIGMRRRRAQRYRRWTYTFDTELDALNSSYLSYVPLLDDIPGYGKVAILTSISADRITVSEPLEWEPGKSHVVAYRDENGDTVGPFPCTQGPDEYTLLVEIPQPWPAVLPGDREPTHVYFGTTERWCFPALITQISPNGPLEVSVTASNYDERVYADDDNSPQ
jgi:hypothetical protein